MPSPKLLFILSFLVCQQVGAQSYDSFWGWSAGASFSFGSKVNRIGIQGAIYYNYAIVQGNSQLNVYYDIQSLGLKQKTPEVQLGFGLDVGFGREDTVRNKFVGLTENNMQHIYSVGYSYIRYWDRQQTKQSTGIISFNADGFKMLMENDLWAGGQGWRDRFRTGAFLFEYQYFDRKFALGITMWTGDYSESPKVERDGYRARFGYRSAENSIHGNRSVGLIYLQVRQWFPLHQMPRIDLGIDSEWVRHILQNKVFHDLSFLPTRVIKHKPFHLPMLQKDGSQFLFREEQKVRPPSLYVNVGLNNMVCY